MRLVRAIHRLSRRHLHSPFRQPRLRRHCCYRQNGSKISASAPIALTWGAVTGATSYNVTITAAGAFSPIISTSVAAPTYTIAAGALARGVTYTWAVTVVSGGGNSAPSSFTFTTLSNVVADFDADGKTDVSVFRPTTGQWLVLQSSNTTLFTQQWGVSVILRSRPTTMVIARQMLLSTGQAPGNGSSDHLLLECRSYNSGG